MEERLFAVKIDGHIVAEGMTLEFAMLLVEAVIRHFDRDRMTVCISPMLDS